MNKSKMKVGIIGVGKMGTAILTGLKKSGNFTRKDILFSNNDQENIRLAKNADLIIIAVKPETVGHVLKQVKKEITKDKLLISVAARVKIKAIQQIIGNLPVIRVMPNICAAVGESMSCWVKSAQVSDVQIQKIEFLLNSIGKEIMLSNESLLDYITVLSGSGPAYFFYLTELFYDFAKKLNLTPKLAEKIIKQTFLGSAQLAFNSAKTPISLKKEVTSKGGTTEAVFKILEKEKFGKTFLKALSRGLDRVQKHNY